MNLYHSIMHFFSERWADFTSFVRFGIRDRFRALFQGVSDLSLHLEIWRESLPAIRKNLAEERKQALIDLWEKLTIVPYSLASFAWSIFRSPGQIKEHWLDFIDRIGSFSIKDFIAVTWRNYVILVVGFIDFVESCVQRFIALPLIYRGILGILTVMLIVAGVTAPWWVREIRAYRAENIYATAKELNESERKVDAFITARTAALLDPNEETLSAALEYANQINNPEAIWWSEQLAKVRGFQPDDIAQIVENGVNYNHLAHSSRFLSMLQSMDPDSAAAADSEIRILLSSGRFNQALNRSYESLRKGLETPLIFETIVRLNKGSPDPVVRESVHQHLLDGIFRNDDIGIHMSELALGDASYVDGSYPAIDFMAIYDHLSQHPDATRDHRVLAAGRAMEANQISREEAIDAILSEYDLTDFEERHEALESLNFFRLGGVADSFIDFDDLPTNRDHSREFLFSLVLGNPSNFELAEELIAAKRQRSALTESDQHFWQALIHYRNDLPELFTVDLIQGLHKADPQDWDGYDEILRSNTGPEQQVVFFRELFGKTESNPFVTRRYIMLLYRLALDTELRICLDRIELDQFRNDPKAMSLAIYLQSLLGTNLAACRYYGEKLISDFPENFSFYAVLALAYAQSGEPEFAREFLESLPMTYEPDQLDTYVRMAYALVTGDTKFLPDIEDIYLPAEKEFHREMQPEKVSLDSSGN
ncbi:MAG: hypothetical protein AAFX93_05265 [Verrucomicrobiota bacterium]